MLKAFDDTITCSEWRR